jgi:cyclic beta-1,2-glucan synthetase
VTAFAVQLVQRLREQDRAVTPALLWLDQRLGAQGTTSDDIVRVEHQRQAAMNVTVRNVILSMSLMSALDWTEFFESRQPRRRGAAARPTTRAMDFATRDAYRTRSKSWRGARAGPSWTSRARPWRNARRGGSATTGGRDPGFYLIGNGRPTSRRRSATEHRCCADCSLYVGLATPGYLGTIVVLSAAMIALPLLAAWAPAWDAAPSCLALLASSQPRTWRSPC